MKKKFTNINLTLDKILRQYNLAHLYAIESIKKDWFNMDKTIAAHSDPIEYIPEKKLLKIRIENLNWKNEFFENRTLLLSKIQNYFKNIEIKNIEFI
jgi:hypothetical protein